MKKRIGSLLLSLALCLSLLPVSARAEGETHSHCTCGETHANVGDHQTESTEITWSAVNDSLPSNSGYYYLTDNVTLSDTWQPADGTFLCLNGHTITGASGKAVITVENNVTFTLTDCGTAGTITHSSGETGCGVTVSAGGTFYMYGGTISGNKAEYGGGVHVSTSSESTAQTTFNLYGGSISGNTATASGGGVYVGGGVFKMSPAQSEGEAGTSSPAPSITGNKAVGTSGKGGVYIGKPNNVSGTFTMQTGTISKNTATQYGGGVYVDGGSTFTMSPAQSTGEAGTASPAPSITENTVSNGSGGGVYLNNGSFKVSGPVSVKDNTTGSGTSAVTSNVYLDTGKLITVDGALNSGDTTASIGVSVASNYGDTAFTSGWKDKMGDTAEPTDYFTPDNNNELSVKKTTDGELMLKGHEHTWTYAVDASNSAVINATCGSCSAHNEAYVGATYTIAAPAPASGSELIYNGSAQKATVARAEMEGLPADDAARLLDAPTQITYQVKDGDNWTVLSEGAPTSAGTYKAAFTLSEGEGTEQVSASVEYTIGRASLSASNFNVTIPNNPVYDGTDKTVTVKVKDGIIGAGEMTGVHYRKDGTNKQITITAADEHQILCQGETDNTYYSITGDTLTYHLAAGAQAGQTAQILVQVSNCANYADYTITVTITVDGKDTEALTGGVTQEGCTYGETLPDPVYTIAEDTIKTTVTYTGTLYKDNTTYNSTTKPTDAGSYTVTVSCETADTIYTASADFTIEKKSISDDDNVGNEVVVTLGGPSLTYTGVSQTQTVTKVMLGDVDITDSCTITNNTVTNAGTFKLFVETKESSNYNGLVLRDYTVARKPITPASQWPHAPTPAAP